MSAEIKTEKTRYVIGNWKMHTTHESALHLVHGLIDGLKNSPVPEHSKVIVCPPYPHLYSVGEALRHSELKHIFLGAQDCSAKDAGTGDVPASMLVSMGVKYVILGHSERRVRHHETDELIRAKAAWVKQAGLIPIICIGENLEDRETGQRTSILQQQITGSLEKDFSGILAYEPVWAVGTGTMATPEQLKETFSIIHMLLKEHLQAAPPPVLYGGSVKSYEQTKEIFEIDAEGAGIDGVLVGKACLEFAPFLEIIRASA